MIILTFFTLLILTIFTTATPLLFSTFTNITLRTVSLPPENAGSSRRGIAYNEVRFIDLFDSSTGHTTWCYNWDSEPYAVSKYEFVPMLHSMRDDHTGKWRANAMEAINGDRDMPTHLLGFNEPDNCQ